MDHNELCAYLAAKRGASDGYPFGPGVLVYKVGGKMFALVSEDKTPSQLSLKCDPEQALFLRDAYTAVQPGYHLSKRHWNTVTLDGSVPDDEIYAWIDDSYRLVVQTLSKAARQQIESKG